METLPRLGGRQIIVTMWYMTFEYNLKRKAENELSPKVVDKSLAHNNMVVIWITSY